MICIGVDRKNVIDYLKSIEPFTVSSHHDADGVYSAVLLSKVFEISVIEFPDKFGDYENSQVSLDLGSPLNKDWNGLVIDHHPHDQSTMKYKLVWDVYPTGLIVYELFKDLIPQEYSWLVSGSLVGDGQPSMIPAEVWENNPELLEMRGSIYESYGKTSLYEYPLYSLLASPINATCRLGNSYSAYKILKQCRSPDDVISHPVFKEDQDTLNQEYDRVINEFGRDRKNRRNTMEIGEFLIIPFESQYRIASRIASSLQSITRKTIISINYKIGEISVRGDLAYLVMNKLQPLGWTIGGHAGYVGGDLGNRTLQDFISDLRKSIRG